MAANYSGKTDPELPATIFLRKKEKNNLFNPFHFLSVLLMQTPVYSVLKFFLPVVLVFLIHTVHANNIAFAPPGAILYKEEKP